MFDNSQARDSAGRFAAVSGRRSVAPHDAKQSIGTHVAAHDDFTVDSRTGKTPSSGYMVGGGGRFIGGWTDKATGKYYTEHSTRVDSAPLARSLGRMRNQIAVFDLQRKREIATGGTGRVK